MKVAKGERETIIVFNEADDEASIFKFNTDLKKRLSAFAKRFPQLTRLDRSFPEGSVEYIIDKSRLSIRFTAPYSEGRRKATKRVRPAVQQAGCRLRTQRTRTEYRKRVLWVDHLIGFFIYLRKD